MKSCMSLIALVVLEACSQSSGSEQKSTPITSPDIEAQGQQSFVGTTWCGADVSGTDIIKIVNFYSDNNRTGLLRDYNVDTEAAYSQSRLGWDMDGNLLTVWRSDTNNAPWVLDGYVSYQKTGDTLQMIVKDETSNLLSVYSSCQR